MGGLCLGALALCGCLLAGPSRSGKPGPGSQGDDSDKKEHFAQFRLGPAGEMLVWLVSGPFPNVGALELRGTGFATDYLTGEANATGVEGVSIPMIPAERETDPTLTIRRRPGWILGLGSATNGVDLGALLDGSKPAIAYMSTTLMSPEEKDAQILFGSDDGAKVYVNGELLFQKQIARGIKRDEDRVPIHLKAGANRILFKIEQGNGDWGLLARVADLQGVGLTDVTERLDLDPNAAPSAELGERWIRSAVGRAGTLDVSAAVAYDRVALRANRWIERFRREAQDPEDLDSALGESLTKLRGAADASTLSVDLLSGANQISRSYEQSRAKIVRDTQNARPLFRTDVQKEDYASVMPGGRYFVHADGSALIPIGYNHNPDWPEFEEANPEGRVYRPQETERYVAHLKASGVNVLRLMIETPPTGNLEAPIGTFSPEHVRWIDTIVSAARKNDIKLIVTPWDTFWMNRRFDTTPYNPLLGGDLRQKIDFIQSPVLREQEKRRLRYLIDRWGNSGTIFSWELLNEADLWWGATPEQLRAWIVEIATYTREYELKKWGRNHLLSVSFAEPMPTGPLGVDAFSLPVLDYATTHLYIGASRAPKESVGPALAIQQGVRFALAQMSNRRPYMDTENGPIDKWIESAELDDEVFRGMTWAHLASGAAGSGFRWPYRNPHHLTEGMLASLKAMNGFVREAPWRSLAGERVRVSVSGPEGAATCGFGTPESAMVWTSGAGQITVRWPAPPAHVNLRVFDCRAGRWLLGGTVRRVSDQFVISPPGNPNSFAALLTSEP